MTLSSRKTGLRMVFGACASGSVALEFVLVFPLLLGVLMAGNELARFLRIRQQLSDYAAMVAYDVAGATSPITAESLRELIQRVGLVAPELIDPSLTPWSADPGNYLAVGITMVAMSPQTSSCTSIMSGCPYDGKVAWSFGNKTPSCVTLSTAPANGPNTLANLPAGAFQRSPVVVVDVSVVYKPLFANGINLSAFGNLTHVDLLTSTTLTTFAWQSVRNWRNTGASSYPGLASTSAGVWTATPAPPPCPGVT